MFPLLFPLVLVLYGEYSRDLETRYTSRMLLYGYAGGIFVSMLGFPTITGIILSGIVTISFPLLAIVHARSAFLKTCISFAMVLVSLNYITILTGLWDFILNIPWYSDNSARIIREILVAGLCVDHFKKDDDEKLTPTIIMLYVIEYFYMKNY